MLNKLLASLTMAAILGICPVADAQAAYPERPVTIIIPFAAGGDTDVIGRLMAAEMSKKLGQVVAVQNVVGANGMNGMNTVATAKPDGYTLGFCPPAPMTIHPYLRKLPYSMESFTIIGRAYNAPCFLVVPGSSPWKNITDMITFIKENPSKFFWASSGTGSVPHLGTLSFFKAFHISAGNHIGFNGDADAFQALAGNRAQLYTSTAANIGTYDVKPLVLLSDKRHPAYPDIPTAKDLGNEVNVSLYGTLFAPKGTPDDIIAVVSEAMKFACESPAYTEALARLGLESAYLGPDEALSFIRAEATRNQELIRSLAGK